jgi:hypothetical protein
MRTLAFLVSWTLLIGAVGVAQTTQSETSPPPQQSPTREDADDAQARNEARSRPTRAAADRDDEDKKDADQKNLTRTEAAKPAQEVGDRKDKDDDENAGDDKNEESGKLSLSASQQEAVGIRTETPRQLTSAPQIDAYATVLDPLALLTDSDRIESTRAAAEAASADATRQGNLYRDGAQASLKAVQASRAQSVEASAQAQAALMSFRQQWGPLASLSEAQRHTLLEALGGGRRLLLRAEVPGRHFGGAIGRDALVEVDGVHITARVLGALPRTDAQSQSAGWLLEVERAPEGFGPGARATARLKAGLEHGLLVPAAALVYSQAGTYVYRRIAGEQRDSFGYESVAVKPLTRIGQAWLVQGLGGQDQIVVQGAGVLWSLQGIASFSAAEEEHD